MWACFQYHPPHQRKRKKLNFEQKLDLWVEVWSVHIDKFFYYPACHHISHERYKSSYSCLLANVKDQFSNEYGSWFGCRKRQSQLKEIFDESIFISKRGMFCFGVKYFCLLNTPFSFFWRFRLIQYIPIKTPSKTTNSIFLCKKDTSMQPTSLSKTSCNFVFKIASSTTLLLFRQPITLFIYLAIVTTIIYLQ